MLNKVTTLLILLLFVFCSTVHASYINKTVTAKIIDFGVYELVGHSIVLNAPETAVGKRRLICPL